MQRTALIINGGGSIGRECAITLAQKGYAVALHTQEDEMSASLLCSFLRRLSGRAMAISEGRLSRAAVEKMALQVAQKLGGPHAVIINATIEADRLAAQDEEIHQDIRQISAGAVKAYCRALADVRGGRAPNVYVIAPRIGIYGAPNIVPYFENHQAMLLAAGNLAAESPDVWKNLRVIDPYIIDTALEAREFPCDDAGIETNIASRSQVAQAVLGHEGRPGAAD